MPDRCAVFGCSNHSNSEKGISLHRIPFWNDEHVEAKRRRKRWMNFVATKRAKWTPTKLSVVCSQHFKEEDYDKYVVEIPGTKKYTARLKKDILVSLRIQPYSESQILQRWFRLVRNDRYSHEILYACDTCINSYFSLVACICHKHLAYKSSSIIYILFILLWTRRKRKLQH